MSLFYTTDKLNKSHLSVYQHNDKCINTIDWKNHNFHWILWNNNIWNDWTYHLDNEKNSIFRFLFQTQLTWIHLLACKKIICHSFSVTMSSCVYWFEPCRDSKHRRFLIDFPGTDFILTMPNNKSYFQFPI